MTLFFCTTKKNWLKPGFVPSFAFLYSLLFVRGKKKRERITNLNVHKMDFKLYLRTAMFCKIDLIFEQTFNSNKKENFRSSTKVSKLKSEKNLNCLSNIIYLFSYLSIHPTIYLSIHLLISYHLSFDKLSKLFPY